MLPTAGDPGPSPEQEILLCCARASVDADAADRLGALLRRELDWDAVGSLAIRHGVVPLVHRNLERLQPQAVPTRVRDRLGETARSCSWRNLELTGELLELLDLFSEHGISAVPYKGPSLAADLYGDISLRQFGDLDLLVRRDDVLRAKDLLLARGYEPEYRLDREQEAGYLDSACEYTFERRDDQLLVEIHWRILPRRFNLALDAEDLWPRLRPVELVGRTVPGLAPEDLLIVLCVHGFKHLWSHLKWICDVAELVRSRPMSWPEVFAEAESLGVKRRVSVGLLLAHALLGARIPETVEREVRSDRTARSLAAWARGRLFADEENELSQFEIDRQRQRFVERFRDRAHFVRCALRAKHKPNRKDRALVPLPRFLHFLYYVIRPLRLLREYGLKSPRLLLTGLFGR